MGSGTGVGDNVEVYREYISTLTNFTIAVRRGVGKNRARGAPKGGRPHLKFFHDAGPWSCMLFMTSQRTLVR